MNQIPITPDGEGVQALLDFDLKISVDADATTGQLLLTADRAQEILAHAQAFISPASPAIE